MNTAPQQEKLLAEAKTKPAATAKTAPKRPIVVESATNDSEITFKIQILTSSKPLAKNDKRLKGLKEVDYYKEGEYTNIRMEPPPIITRCCVQSAPLRHNSKTPLSSLSETARK